MKKKSKGQIFLERVEMIDVLVENKLIERKQWRELAMNITANMGGERVQSSRATTSKMEDCVVKCLMVEDEIAVEVDRLIEEKQKAVQTIERLHSPMEYRVLHMRYIRYMDFEGIADDLKKDYSWVTTTHGRAVKHVMEILSKEKDDG